MRYPQILTGVVKKHPDGYGFCIPDESHHEDVYISKSQMKGIMSEDHLEVEVFVRRGRLYGKVKKILKRSREFVLGAFIRVSKTKGCIKDEENFFGEDIYFDHSRFSSLKPGDWVQVQITSYPGSKKGFKGNLVKVLGSFPDALIDNIKTLNAFNIPYAFTDKMEQEHFSIQEKDFQNREDLRSLPFVTIDGETAKDFDDAIYVEKMDSGWKLFVSIADVSFYVKEGSVLDQEAYKRGNSTYFPHFCSPMLPEFLSQDLCSLNPKQPRLTMTAEIHFDSAGVRKKSIFYESVIWSHERLTYGQVQEFFDGQGSKLSSSVSKSLSCGYDLAKILFQKRLKEGSLNLDIPETEIRLDSRGYPLDIFQSKRLFSHQLIEEMMLACNQAVAEFLKNKKLPSLYRVHDIPDIEDIQNLQSFVQSLDSSINIVKKSNGSQNNFQTKLVQLIQSIKNHSKKSTIHSLILRALPQACYSAHNRGHFGLGFDYYTHFTSPIRRYSDLIVHRVLKQVLGITKDFHLSKESLEAQAQLLSQCEQRSVKAERFIEGIKKARFMQSYIDKEMEGVISSITKFGFFVTLKQFDVDGLVHMDSLGGRWVFDPTQMLIRGRTSGYIFRQGDPVLVRIFSASIESGRVDFLLLKHKGSVFKAENRHKSKNRYKRKSKDGRNNQDKRGQKERRNNQNKRGHKERRKKKRHKTSRRQNKRK